MRAGTSLRNSVHLTSAGADRDFLRVFHGAARDLRRSGSGLSVRTFREAGHVRRRPRLSFARDARRFWSAIDCIY